MSVPAARSKTVTDALQEGAAQLRAAEVADAAGDARVLMAHALDIPKSRLTLMAHDPLSPLAAERFVSCVARRAQRVPVSHIVGYREFYGRRFRVTSDVLDPRPETETLVAAALEAPFHHVLDLGTGSGAILMSLLAERPEARGLGTDLSPAALQVARENAEQLGVAPRVALRQADWWAGITGRFDLILSNPPYITQAEYDGLAPELRLHEPRDALTPGGDGLGAYRQILAGLATHLAPAGRVFLEIGADQGQAVALLCHGQDLGDVAVLRDLDGRDRVVSIHARPDIAPGRIE